MRLSINTFSITKFLLSITNTKVIFHELSHLLLLKIFRFKILEFELNPYSGHVKIDVSQINKFKFLPYVYSVGHVGESIINTFLLHLCTFKTPTIYNNLRICFFVSKCFS